MFYTNLFVLIVAAVHFNFKMFEFAVLVVGYLIVYRVERYLRKERRSAIINSEFEGWSDVEDDSSMEQKGGLARLKLSPDHEALFSRTARLLHNIL